MNPKKITLPIITLLVITIAFIKCSNQPNIVSKLNDLRKNAQPEMDSTMNALAAENRFLDSITLLIKNKKLKEATSVVNQLINISPNRAFYHVLKAQIYEANKQQDSAFYEYNRAILIQPIPSALDGRAAIFSKECKYDSALNDYQKIYELNYDYSLQIAQIFELKKQKDSALKYYKIYLEHYPDSLSIKQKVSLLQK